MLEADCGEIPSPLPGIRQSKSKDSMLVCVMALNCLALPVSYSLAEILLVFLNYHVCHNRIKGLAN